MKHVLAALPATAFIAVTIACEHSATAPSGSAAGAAVAALAIDGPQRLAPGETARFTAMATMSDGSRQDYTQKVSWLSHPGEVLTIARSTGEATARGAGDAVIWADLAGSCCGGTRTTVLVLPANTYRLTGRVQESALPVQGATVTVMSGIGSGLSVATDYDGQYRLYGVAGPLRIKVSKPGYIDLVKDFSASQNDVLDFPEARQAEPIPSIAGSYLITLQPDPGCPTSSPDARSLPLPAEMQQPRSYAVQITQEGAALHVAGPPPGFLPPSDHFDGRILPGGVEFDLGGLYIGYGPDSAFTAQLSATQALSYEGHVYATRVGSTIAGRLDGDIQLFEKSTFNKLVGQCIAANHRFSLSASTGGGSR